ncbi:transferase [Arachnia propionica]|uniref:transferase n=1 Tax=Arachnia propionica TaxID=1750 RepID=UPI003C6F490D
MAECILCGSDAGVIVLDLGAQPSPRHWPLPTDPLPDPTHALALRLCPDCGLAQLDADDTTEPEVPVPEPRAVVDQARRAVADLGGLGHLDGRTSVVEFGSPHGGSWLPLLDLTPTDGPADLVVDSFGLMHERDLPAALARRAGALADDGLAAFLIQPLGDVVAQSAWTVLRHGHHGYFTLTSLRTALGTVGLTPTSVLRYDLYGGVAVVLASRGGQPDADLLAAYDDESRRGLAIPEGLACLAEAVSVSTGRLRSYLEGHRAAGTRLFAYGAASKAVAELAMVGDAAGAILAVGDASPAKQGRCMPASRIPVISPAELVAADPREVLLLLPDLHDELLATHPSLAGRVVVPGAGPTGTPRPIPPGGAATCPGTPGRNAGDR